MLLVFSSFLCWSQTKIIVTDIPKNTPPQNPIYLTGDFNQWSPSDPEYRLTHREDGMFEITIDDAVLPTEFKFCRGQFSMMEGGEKGRPIANRVLKRQSEEIELSIVSWTDLEYYELIVTRVPPNTPVNDPIYVAGRFNDWQAAEEEYKLKHQKDGTYTVRLPGWIDTLEYKYNRGTWIAVEGDDQGFMKSNRYFMRPAEMPVQIRDVVHTWEDLATMDSYTFLVEKVPDYTPYDASIYIAGNFNNWNTANSAYKLIKLDDGTYTFTLYGGPDEIEYKFTRGSWETVEGRSNGRALENRVYKRTSGGSVVIPITIKTWEDFSGASINYINFILIIATILAFLLVLALQWMENGRAQANKILSLALIICIVVWIGRILIDYRDMFNWQPKLILLPDFIYFVYPPLMFFYVQSLLSIRPRISVSKWVSLIPTAILFITYLPLLVQDPETFIDGIVERRFHNQFAIVGGIALIYNFYYWFRSLRLLTIYTKNLDNTQSFDQSHYFLNSLLTLYAFCLFSWFSTYVIGAVDLVLDTNLREVVYISIDITWVLFAGSAFLLTYFALSEPELFRVSEVVEKYKYSQLTDESASKLKQQLSKLMDEQKPFLNPKLTLLELAEILETNTNSLSRVINEGYSRNFYDFINYYRIEEFKELVNRDDHKNHTFLAIAYEVGFSSKTTFNRAFKKLEGLTPREYYNKLMDSESSSDLSQVVSGS